MPHIESLESVSPLGLDVNFCLGPFGGHHIPVWGLSILRAFRQKVMLDVQPS